MIKNISELIKYLERVKEKERDITVCTPSEHEYW